MSGPNWYDRAEDELTNDLNEGRISQSEYNAEMRNLNAELRQAAEDAADDAYNSYMEGW